MARGRAHTANFAAGELAPLLDGRADWQPYHNGAREMVNMIALPEGAAERRPGTQFVTYARDGAGAPIPDLVPFEFNVEQTYILEIGNKAMRAFVPGPNGGLVVCDGHDASLTNGTFDTNLSGWTLTQAGSATVVQAAGKAELRSVGSDEAAIEQSVTITTGPQNVVVAFTVGGAPCGVVTVTWGTASRDCAPGFHTLVAPADSSPMSLKFSNVQGYTLTIDDVRLLGSGQAGQAVPFELELPWTGEAMLQGGFVQSADVLFICGDDGAVRNHVIKRFGTLDWAAELFDFADGPYLPQIDPDHTMNADAASGIVEVTSNKSWVFWESDVGRPIAIKNASTLEWAWGTIVKRKQSTQVEVLARGEHPFEINTPTKNWRIGSYALLADDRVPASARPYGFPTATTLYQQRLVLGGPPRQPNRYDTTVVGDFFTFTPGGNAADALSGPLTHGGVNAIRWFASGRRLVAGTAGAEITIGDGALTVLSAPEEAVTRYGCAPRRPVQLGNDTILYVARGGRLLMDMTFDQARSGLGASELTVRAKHIGERRFRQLAHQQTPHHVVWAALEDGGLVGLTHMREQQVVAFHRHDLGATAAGPAKVLSIGSVPTINAADNDGQDDVWMVVERTVNGETRRMIERLTTWRGELTAPEDMVYPDSSLSYDGAATTTIAGLDHLEGESVQVLADGAVQPARIVSGGEITLDTAASKVHVGLASPARLVPQRPVVGSPDGTSAGRMRTFGDIAAHVHRSNGFQIGTVGQPLETVLKREPESLGGPQLFTGYVAPGPVASAWKRDLDLVLEQRQPLPLTVKGITYTVDVGAQ